MKSNIQNLEFIYDNIILQIYTIVSLRQNPIFWGKLSDRIKKRKILIIVGSLLSLLTTMYLWINGHSYIVLMIIFLLIGISTSCQTLGYTMTAERNDLQLTGSSIAFISILIMGGGALSQFIFDIIMLKTSYYYAYIIIPACLLLAFMLSFFINETWRVVSEEKFK